MEIINEDFFSCSLDRIERDNLLVIGNPPWVNSSTLSSLGTKSAVRKSNFKGARGIDAMTGAGDFDICEAVILRILEEFKGSNTTVAMLCKTSVARNVFTEIKRRGICFKCCSQVEIDAMKIFGVSVSACLLLVQLTQEESSPDTCNVYSYENWNTAVFTYECKDGKLCSTLSSAAADYEGECCFNWRQGVKHDCSKVMELTLGGDGNYINGYGESVCLEPDLVFPLVKSSCCRQPVISVCNKFVIVTQNKAGEDTPYIKTCCPQTWKYLEEHKEMFSARRSLIYTTAPENEMFGVGVQLFQIQGLRQRLLQRPCLLPSVFTGRQAFHGGSCYFICFNSYNLAYTAMLYLNSGKVQGFLKSISFADAKRPYSKKVLGRIDFSRICKDETPEDLEETECRLCLPAYITPGMVGELCKTVYMHSITVFA